MQGDIRYPGKGLLKALKGNNRGGKGFVASWGFEAGLLPPQKRAATRLPGVCEFPISTPAPKPKETETKTLLNSQTLSPKPETFALCINTRSDAVPQA